MRKHFIMNKIKVLINVKCLILQTQPQCLDTYCGNVGNIMMNLES